MAEGYSRWSRGRGLPGRKLRSGRMPTEDWALWLNFRGRNPKRVIAALELLGTILAVKIWGGTAALDMEGCLEAFTDNKGNMFALRRGMSTKYPLTILLMELSEVLRKSDCNLDLTWVKRDENQDADDLSNMEFKNFDMSRRVDINGKELEWMVFKQMDEASRKLYEKLNEETSKGRKAAKILLKW